MRQVTAILPRTGVISADDDYAGIGHVPSARAVGIEIVANQGVLRNTNVLIQDGAAQLGAASDVAVVHDDAAFYQGAGVDANTASENGLAHDAAGENASARYDAVEGLAAAIGLVEGELGGRIGVASTAQRPLAIEEVELGLDVVQVHVGFVVGLDGADITPVGDGVFGLAGNAVGLEVVGIDGSVVGELGQDVPAEIVMTVGVFRVGLEQIQKSGRRKDVVAHRGVDPAGIDGHGGRVGVLFVKGQDASLLVGLNDTEFRGVLSGKGVGGDGHFRVPSYVEIDHAGDVHAVDVVGTTSEERCVG